MNLEDFTRAAAFARWPGACLRVEGDSVRTVGAVRGLFSLPSTRRQTMTAFLDALRAHYGDHFADMLAARAELRVGRRLTCAQMNATLAEANNARNQFRAQVAAFMQGDGPNALNAALDDWCANAAVRSFPGFRLSPEAKQRLAQRIGDDLLSGRYRATTPEAMARLVRGGGLPSQGIAAMAATQNLPRLAAEQALRDLPGATALSARAAGFLVHTQAEALTEQIIARCAADPEIAQGRLSVTLRDRLQEHTQAVLQDFLTNPEGPFPTLSAFCAGPDMATLMEQIAPEALPGLFDEAVARFAGNAGADFRTCFAGSADDYRRLQQLSENAGVSAGMQAAVTARLLTQDANGFYRLMPERQVQALLHVIPETEQMLNNSVRTFDVKGMLTRLLPEGRPCPIEAQEVQGLQAQLWRRLQQDPGRLLDLKTQEEIRQQVAATASSLLLEYAARRREIEESSLPPTGQALLRQGLLTGHAGPGASAALQGQVEALQQAAQAALENAAAACGVGARLAEISAPVRAALAEAAMQAIRDQGGIGRAERAAPLAVPAIAAWAAGVAALPDISRAFDEEMQRALQARALTALPLIDAEWVAKAPELLQGLDAWQADMGLTLRAWLGVELLAGRVMPQQAGFIKANPAAEAGRRLRGLVGDSPAALLRLLEDARALASGSPSEQDFWRFAFDQAGLSPEELEAVAALTEDLNGADHVRAKYGALWAALSPELRRQQERLESAGQCLRGLIGDPPAELGDVLADLQALASVTPQPRFEAIVLAAARLNPAERAALERQLIAQSADFQHHAARGLFYESRLLEGLRQHLGAARLRELIGEPQAEPEHFYASLASLLALISSTKMQKMNSENALAAADFDLEALRTLEARLPKKNTPEEAALRARAGAESPESQKSLPALAALRTAVEASRQAAEEAE